MDITLGEKIKLIRTEKKISLRNMAQAIKISKTLASYIENGQRECDTKTLAAIRNFLEINDAPLLEHERELYIARLWIWDDTLSADRIAEAAAMQKELAPIQALPYEHELLFTYAILEARLLIKQMNSDAACEKIASVEAYKDIADNRALKIYHQCKSVIYMQKSQSAEALEQLHRVLALSDSQKPDSRVTSTIGVVYYTMGNYYRAINYLERAIVEDTGSKVSALNITNMAFLVNCYIGIGEYDKARKLNDEAIRDLHCIESYADLLPYVMFSKGELYRHEGNWIEAIAVYDEILTYHKDDNLHSIVNTRVHAAYSKAIVLTKLKRLDEAQDTIDQARLLAKDNRELTIKVDSIYHLVNIGNPESAAYLEEVSIPCLRALGGLYKYDAIGICRELEAHYQKKRSKVKALTMACVIRDIQDELFLNR